jgi:serine/threonine protein phosphatase PrpC
VALCFVRDGTIFTAWAGDSRAVLVKRGMRAVELSHDHKPNRPDEKDRIRSLGGQVGR